MSLLPILLVASNMIFHTGRTESSQIDPSPIHSKIVMIEGKRMSVFSCGTGEHTLVFMSGSQTCSPILDFKSLYNLLKDRFRIVVIEKFGYGYSDVTDRNKDIESLVNDDRAAVSGAGIEGPYVLCPHSMSGIEAIYWAQNYPEEVEAIIGLDMAVPDYYREGNVNINIGTIRLFRALSKAGMHSLLPGAIGREAVVHGNLSKEEKKEYLRLFRERTMTDDMFNECLSIKTNAAIVNGRGYPQIPTLLFVSNAKGVGITKERWLDFQKGYVKGNPRGEIISLDCPHYVHNYLYREIAQKISEFFQ